MLSTGIKNSILIILIILILHFFIKNLLLSKREEPTRHGASINNTGGLGSPGSPGGHVSPGSPGGLGNHSGIAEWHEAPVQKIDIAKPTSSDKDLYDSWFGSEKPDIILQKGNELEKCQEVLGLSAKPLVADIDNMLPLSSCEPIKINNNIVQDKKGMLVLNEYENENIMNGGKLFMGLEAYDKKSEMYAPL